MTAFFDLSRLCNLSSLRLDMNFAAFVRNYNVNFHGTLHFDEILAIFLTHSDKSCPVSYVKWI